MGNDGDWKIYTAQWLYDGGPRVQAKDAWVGYIMLGSKEVLGVNIVSQC